jgi:ribonuclease P protein component
VTVSSKVGNAVERNYVKRRVREAFRLVPTPLRAAAAFVVIAKSGATGLSQRETAAELGGLFSADV